MGTVGSKPEGVVTVVSQASSRAASTTEGVDPLLQHLASLKEHVPRIETTIDQLDPESVWKDIEVAKGLRQDTADLNEAVLRMLTAYQEWHADNVKASISNQEYIHRLVDQADSKAARALAHLGQQTVRLKAISTSLAEVSKLPATLQQLTEQTSRLQQQLADLEAASSSRGGA